MWKADKFISGKKSKYVRIFITGKLFELTKLKILNTNMKLATSFTPK